MGSVHAICWNLQTIWIQVQIGEINHRKIDDVMAFLKIFVINGKDLGERTTFFKNEMEFSFLLGWRSTKG